MIEYVSHASAVALTKSDITLFIRDCFLYGVLRKYAISLTVNYADINCGIICQKVVLIHAAYATIFMRRMYAVKRWASKYANNVA